MTTDTKQTADQLNAVFDVNRECYNLTEASTGKLIGRFRLIRELIDILQAKGIYGNLQVVEGNDDSVITITPRGGRYNTY
jgi:hypothetical protein